MMDDEVEGVQHLATSPTQAQINLSKSCGSWNNDPTHPGVNLSPAVPRFDYNSTGSGYGNLACNRDFHTTVSLNRHDKGHLGRPSGLDTESDPSEYDYDPYAEFYPGRDPDQKSEQSVPASAMDRSSGPDVRIFVTDPHHLHPNNAQESDLEFGERIAPSPGSLYASAQLTNFQMEESLRTVSNVLPAEEGGNQEKVHEIDDDDDDLFGPEPVMGTVDSTYFEVGAYTEKDYNEVVDLFSSDAEADEATQASLSSHHSHSLDRTDFEVKRDNTRREIQLFGMSRLTDQEPRTFYGNEETCQLANSNLKVIPRALEDKTPPLAAKQRPNLSRAPSNELVVQSSEHEDSGPTQQDESQMPLEATNLVKIRSVSKGPHGQSSQANGQLSDLPQPISPPQSVMEGVHEPQPGSRQVKVLSSNRDGLPSPPPFKESFSYPRDSRLSRQSSPPDYEGPPLDLDQLPIDQLSRLQLEAQAKMLIDTYKSNGEKAKDPTLQNSLHYLAQLNPESQILWLSQQPSTMKQRAVHAINAFKKNAESRTAPNIEADLSRLAALDPAKILAYLQWPGPQPVAKVALAAFENEIKQKEWPLDRFKELYLMSSEDQVNYLYERMEFWPGFAKQHGLTSRPSNFDPKWEGRWPESPRLEYGVREMSPPSTSIPGISLTTKSDSRSDSTHLAPPLQSSLLRPPSPKRDVINLSYPASDDIASDSTTSADLEIAPDPPIPIHLFTSSKSALANRASPRPGTDDLGGELLQDRLKTPVLQDGDHGVQQSLEPKTPSHLRYRESSPPYEDRSAAPSPPNNVDIQMKDAPPVLPLNPARVRPSKTGIQPSIPSSPDIITTSTKIISSPSKTSLPSARLQSVSKSRSVGSAPAPATPQSRSKSRSRSPIKTQSILGNTHVASAQTPGCGTPSVPKKSDRRKSLGVTGFKVAKTRRATQGNSNSVRDAVSKIEAGLKKEKEQEKEEAKRNLTPRRSERIRMRKERESISPSPSD